MYGVDRKRDAGSTAVGIRRNETVDVRTGMTDRYTKVTGDYRCIRMVRQSSRFAVWGGRHSGVRRTGRPTEGGRGPGQRCPEFRPERLRAIASDGRAVSATQSDNE